MTAKRGEVLADRWAGDTMLVTISIIWSTNLPLMKYLLSELTVPGLAALRFGMTALFLLPVIWLRREFISFKLILGGLACGACMTGVMVSAVYGLNYTNSTRAVFLQTMFLVIVPPVSFVIYRRKPQIKMLFSVLLSLIGIYCLTMADDTQNLKFNQGDALCLLSAVFSTCHILTVGHFSRRHDPHCLNAFQMGLTGLACVIWATLMGELTFDITPNAWGTMVFLVVVCTIFTFGGQMWGQRRTLPERASIIYTLIPLSGAVVSAVFLGERMGAMGILGCAIIMSGVVLTVYKPKKITEA